MKEFIENSVACTDEVKQICQPLFEHTHISYFSHFRYYFDGHALGIGSDADLIEYTCHNQLYLRHQDLLDFPEFNVLQSHQSPRNQLVCDFIKVDHILLYRIHHANYFEMSAFGSPQPVNELIDFYLNRLAILRLFARYFKDKAAHLIEKVEKKPIFLEKFDQGNITGKTKLAYSQELRDAVHGDILLEDFSLSPREAQCMKLVAEGHSTKEIAKLIDLSPNTVQFYINNLKEKVNCRKVAEIIKLYYQNLYKKD